MARKTLLTPALIDEVCEVIKRGSFDYVAAESVGITKTTFYNWLKEGADLDGDPVKVVFFAKVTEARALARRTAEARVFEENPFVWLRYGPGRERPDAPGWTSETVVTLQSGSKPILLTWDDDANSITETPRITEDSTG
jgi:hypothetical protein